MPKKLQSPTYPFNTFLVASEKKNSKNYFFPRVMALGRYGNCGPWPSSSIPWKGPGTNLGSPSPPTSPHLISLRSTQSAKYWYFEGSELRLLKGSKHVLSWGCSPEIGLSRELTHMSRNANRLELLPLEVLEFLEIGQSGDRPDVRISTAV